MGKNNATQSRMPVNLVSIPPTSVENVETLIFVSDFGITRKNMSCQLKKLFVFFLFCIRLVESVELGEFN